MLLHAPQEAVILLLLLWRCVCVCVVVFWLLGGTAPTAPFLSVPFLYGSIARAAAPSLAHGTQPCLALFWYRPCLRSAAMADDVVPFQMLRRHGESMGEGMDWGALVGTK
jgi:hypothetical protein